MNDPEIRKSFHRKRLNWHHAQQNTLVIDELGLNHGRCRADIAVINGHFVGYEIKGNNDSLRRLEEQVKSYTAVFDRISVVVGVRHINAIEKHVPYWWGVIVSLRGPRGAVNFDTVREPQLNRNVDPISLARLLWRNEAEEILRQKGLSSRVLRQPRAILYEYLVEMLNTRELQTLVRTYFKKRKNWRYLQAL